MVRPLKIRKTVLGEGMPKICVPIIGISEMEIKTQAEAAALAGADLVEWRVDYLEGAVLDRIMEKMLLSLRSILGEIPIVFTMRTRREGGNRRITAKDYRDLLLRAACDGLADLVDVELDTAGEDGFSVDGFVRSLREKGCYVLASNHHFDRTPPLEEMVSKLMAMDQAGADVIKIAVMPEDAADVLALLRVTEMMKRMTQKPVIAMSMGKTGLISRLAGEVFGSALTFGTLGTASAPGQIPLEDLRKILKTIHGEE